MRSNTFLTIGRWLVVLFVVLFVDEFVLMSLYVGEPLNLLREHNGFLVPLLRMVLPATYVALIVLNCLSYAVASWLFPARKYLLSSALTVAVASLGWFVLTLLDIPTVDGFKHAVKSSSAVADIVLIPALLCNYGLFRAWFERQR